jgi:outer membrane protein assembly factor BamB
MPRFRCLVILLAVASFAFAAGDDWPQWLGPNRDGSTAEKVAPWKGDLKIVWRQAVGEGHSSPVVSDGRVFLHTCENGKEVELVQCFDAVTGKPVWSQDYARGPFKGLFGNGPRATPAVVGGKVYTYGSTGILTCLDAKSSDKLWQLDTRKEFKPPAVKFGVSSSPLVVGNKLLVDVGAKGASIVALDKDSGKVLWKSLDDKASYSSPIAIGSDKDSTAVFLTQKGLVGLKVADGTPQWDFPFEDKLAESSTTPVRVGDKLLISSITLGTAMLSLETQDGKTKPKQDWMTKDLTCYFSTPVAIGPDHVYLVTGSLLGGQSTLHCLDAKKGTVLWKKDGVGKYHASLLRTGDNKLLMVEEAGNLVFIDPDPKMYRELARTKICGKTWAHPAVANGRLYIRDDKELICVDLGK